MYMYTCSAHGPKSWPGWPTSMRRCTTNLSLSRKSAWHVTKIVLKVNFLWANYPFQRGL